MFDLNTIIDDEDLRKMGQYSEKTLTERYQELKDKIKAASPPLEAPSSSKPKSD